MLKTLLWVVSNDGRFFQGALNILERQHNGIELVGVTAGAPIGIVKDGKQIPFIPLAEVDRGGVYDVLLVIGAKQIGMSEIVKASRQLKLPEEKLLGDWIVCIPGFTLDKYRKLQRSRLSIFAMNCFGGIMYHTLGLPFRSPFINMWLHASEYIRFLHAPRVYMEEKLVLKEMVWNDVFQYHHPISTLGNIDIVMNHDPNFDDVIAKWERRRPKINWYNLFVTAYTESEEILEQFDALPYGKKVCFVPFKSDLDSAWYINREITKKEHWYITVNDFAKGYPFYYDPFDMLLYGKKTPLIKM